MTTWKDVQQHWTEFKPRVRTRWPKLKEMELEKIAGKRDVLAKTLETDYKLTHTEAEKQIDEFLKAEKPAKAGAK